MTAYWQGSRFPRKCGKRSVMAKFDKKLVAILTKHGIVADEQKDSIIGEAERSNKSLTEYIETTDDILRLNAGATLAASDAGIEVWRGATGTAPQLFWDEAEDEWQVKGTTGVVVLAINDNKTVKICDGGILKPPTRTSDPTPTVDMIPGVYYNSTDRQIKAIVSDGATGAMIVVLG